MSDDTLDPLGAVSRSQLHFFWIADCSGSMRMHGKIQALNNAIHECLPAAREAAEANPFAEMVMRAIKFSSGAAWHVKEPTPVDDFVWHDLTAMGVTDLAAALRLLREELTPEKMGRRALPPVIVLLSDGAPTDDWEHALMEFNDTGWGRAGRTVRVGIALGKDADKAVLAKFTGADETVFEANNAQRLTELIKWASVTLSKFASSGASQVGGSGDTGMPLPPPPPVAVVADDDDDDTW
ncbi:MAG: VWA domain-containing protein [Myxococcota bacterium]|nr:VWA domain-containing protein [Myxococcota bacterium]